MVALGTKILLETAIVRFKLLALLARLRGQGRSVALNWKPGGHLKWKLAQNVSATYWVRTWGLVDAGSKYFLNKNKNKNITATRTRTRTAHRMTFNEEFTHRRLWSCISRWMLIDAIKGASLMHITWCGVDLTRPNSSLLNLTFFHNYGIVF